MPSNKPKTREEIGTTPEEIEEAKQHLKDFHEVVAAEEPQGGSLMVALIGDLNTGFDIIGPFITAEEMEAFADENFLDFQGMELLSPKEYLDRQQEE